MIRLEAVGLEEWEHLVVHEVVPVEVFTRPERIAQLKEAMAEAELERLGFDQG
jgi:hypothetical protein